VILVGDGVTSVGQCELWRGTDGSATFQKTMVGAQLSSEIPTISTSRLRNNVAFLTSWSGVAAKGTDDFGLTWNTVGALSLVSSTWGTDIARDDPNLVVIGQFGGARRTYLSFDGGVGYAQLTNTGDNYAYYIRDRGLILQLQSTGIYKMGVTYDYTPGGAQSVSLASPDGGEVWPAGEVRTIAWSAANVALAVIEYRTGPEEPWLEIAQVPGYAGSYDWTLPSVGTSQARVRVRDAWDSSPSDESTADFTIQLPVALALVSPNGGETLQFGTAQAVQWTSLNIDSIGIDFSTASEGGWTELAAAFPADSGAMTWVIPNTPSNTARVRIREVGGALADSSDGAFEIAVPGFDGRPNPVLVGFALVGGSMSKKVFLNNPGTAPLTVSSAVTDDPEFTVDKSSLVLPDSSLGDSLLVTYSPVESGPDTAVVTLLTDDPAGVHTLTVYGEGTTTVSAGLEMPLAFSLGQNRPNPFTGATRIDYAIPVAVPVKLEVFDLQGKRVATLVDAVQEPGRYAVPFGSGVRAASGASVENVRAGVYFYRLRAGAFLATRKMLLLQ
jgi:hypothetical protein